jgi:4-hydroxy-tetrahydrodipicolinate synthase
MQNDRFKGLGVAMVTPFSSSKAIDYSATDRLLEYLVDGGVDYLVVMGTTGEASTLTDDEKHELIAHVVEKNNGRLPIVLGVGGNSTSSVISSIKHFNLKGVDAILSVTPYYNKPTQKGLEMHFRTVAESSPLPLILYNVPGRTGVNMSAQTTLTLASEVPNIIGIKEASGNLNQMSYILRDRPENFLVISGDDGLALPQMAMGADGIISVLGNAVPKRFSEMVRLASQGKFGEAASIHLELVELIDGLFADGNPGGIKAALSILGIIDNNLRLPLVPVGEATYKNLVRLLKKH